MLHHRQCFAIQKISDQILIADWHSDSLLWNRSLNSNNSYGHIDFPRMRRGSIGLQVFSTVTWVPKKITTSNPMEGDALAKLALANGWPPSTLISKYARARHQSKLLDRAIKKDANVELITSRTNLMDFLKKRQGDKNLLAVMKATEGLHAMEADIKKLDQLIADGFRVMGLVHMFDNKIGGSSYGVDKGGLTDLGKEVIQKLNQESILIDLAHASSKLIDDVLTLSTQPIMVSHTGIRGTQNQPRNLSDTQIKAIANKGGVIGIGFWPTAVGGNGLTSIVASIKYVSDLVGVDHVSLGSDFDGYVSTPIDGGSMPLLVQKLLDSGFKFDEIEKIMGGNQIRFLLANLPKD